MPSASLLAARPLLEDLLAGPPHLIVRHVAEARPRDGTHGREDAAHQVGAAGADVLVCGIDEGLQGHPEGLVPAEVAPPELLQGVPRILGARALGVVVRLLVPSAGDVVLEEPDRSSL